MFPNLDLRKIISLGMLFAFLVNTLGPLPLAQAGASPATGGDFRLPAPGGIVHLSPGFNPPILKGIKVNAGNPFRFDFILDQGDPNTVIPAKAGIQDQEQLKIEVTKLIKYFLASLTIPEKDLWVNLSPYEKDRIIPQSFGLTEMGRDLLAEDYMLKQITASLIYPEDEIGKKFWKRIYEEAGKEFGTTNIPVNTFNKVWIVPEKAVVYENVKAGTAYVVESKLKVMLEQDYLSMSKHAYGGVAEGGASPASAGFAEHAGETRGQDPDINKLGSDIVREIVIPELTREINEGKNFAQLRQVYNSLILATWYKKKIKDSILARVYEDKKKVAGVGYEHSINVEAIYQRYLQAFKKGAYNYIKEEQDPLTQEVVPRKYFSGGFDAASIAPLIADAPASQLPGRLDHAEIVKVDCAMAKTSTITLPMADRAMGAHPSPAVFTIAANHEAWQRLGVYDQWIMHAHVKEIVLWNAWERLEEMSMAYGYRDFINFLDHLKRKGWGQESEAIRLFESAVGQEKSAFNNTVRESHFFRQPIQYPWFYEHFKSLLKQRKALRDKEPLVLDFVGLGLLEEPLTVLALIRSAYESQDVTLEDVPLEINLFDKDDVIAQLYQNDGLVYAQSLINTNIYFFKMELAEHQNFKTQALWKDWNVIENNFKTMFVPITESNLLPAIIKLNISSDWQPWFQSLRFRGQYEHAAGHHQVQFAFMNNLFWTLSENGRVDIVDTMQRRLNKDAIFFEINMPNEEESKFHRIAEEDIGALRIGGSAQLASDGMNEKNRDLAMLARVIWFLSKLGISKPSTTVEPAPAIEELPHAEAVETLSHDKLYIEVGRLYIKAMGLFKKGQLDDAKQIFTQIDAQIPDYQQTRYFLSKCPEGVPHGIFKAGKKTFAEGEVVLYQGRKYTVLGLVEYKGLKGVSLSSEEFSVKVFGDGIKDIKFFIEFPRERRPKKIKGSDSAQSVTDQAMKSDDYPKIEKPKSLKPGSLGKADPTKDIRVNAKRLVERLRGKGLSWKKILAMLSRYNNEIFNSSSHNYEFVDQGIRTFLQRGDKDEGSKDSFDFHVIATASSIVLLFLEDADRAREILDNIKDSDTPEGKNQAMKTENGTMVKRTPEELSFNDSNINERDIRVERVLERKQRSHSAPDLSRIYQVAKVVQYGVKKRRDIITSFLDSVFAKALKYPNAKADTKIIFLKAGAEPLYEAARLMARVTGVFPVENIHSVWATMGNYRAIYKDPRQAELFVKYLYDQQILTPGVKNLLIVDTDTGIAVEGSELIFIETLLNDGVIDRVNARWPELDLPKFNKGKGSINTELYYMYLREGFGEDTESFIAGGALRSGRLKIDGYHHNMFLREAGLAPLAWTTIDSFVNTSSVQDEFELRDNVVHAVEKPPYGQEFSGKDLDTVRQVQYTGLLMGVLDVLEAKGYDVSKEADALVKSLEDRAMDVSKKQNEGGIDLTLANMNLQVKKEIASSSPPAPPRNDTLEGIKLHLDPAQLAQLQNAPGFVPVIISVEPLENLQKFLGVIVNQG